MSSQEGKNRTGVSHRPYDEAFKRAAVAQWANGVPARRVAEGLGTTAESLRTWRRQFVGAPAESLPTAEGKLPAVAPTSQELQAEVRRVRVTVEHAIAGVKRCRIVADTFRNWRHGMVDQVVLAASGLHHLRIATRA